MKWDKKTNVLRSRANLKYETINRPIDQLINDDAENDACDIDCPEKQKRNVGKRYKTI